MTVAMRPDTKRRLEAFVARVDQLRSYSILKDPANVAGMTVRVGEGGEQHVEFHHPTEEATDAALLHIRVLIQRDDISIGRMGELYADPAISNEWKQEHRRMRDWLNTRLDEPYGGGLTYRDVLEAFLHGRRGHFKSTDRGYRLYDQLATDDVARQLHQDTFYQVLVWILAAAHNVAVATRKELARVP